MPINPLGYTCIKKLQRDNLWHAYNEPINFYSVDIVLRLSSHSVPNESSCRLRSEHRNQYVLNEIVSDARETYMCVLGGAKII